MKVMVFTPTYLGGGGAPAMRPECEASVWAQDYGGGIVREVGTFNPWPGLDHRNVLAQYERARELFLESDCGALLTLEHDVVLPADGLTRLVEGLGRLDYSFGLTPAGEHPGVVFGVYMLRHGSKVLNAWEYVGDNGMGESLSLNAGKLREARRAGRVRVSGVGWGCTLIRREVVEAVRFRDGGGENPAGDIAFAMDCLYRGVVMIADFDVACDHFDGELRLRPFGGAMNDSVAVVALQDVTVMGPGGRQGWEAGGRYRVSRGLLDDLVRAGYARISAVEGPGEDKAVDDVGGAEFASVEPNERAVRAKGRRRKEAG